MMVIGRRREKPRFHWQADFTKEPCSMTAFASTTEILLLLVLVHFSQVRLTSSSIWSTFIRLLCESFVHSLVSGNRLLLIEFSACSQNCEVMQTAHQVTENDGINSAIFTDIFQQRLLEIKQN